MQLQAILLVFLLLSASAHPSITFPNASDSNELHEGGESFRVPSLVDGVAGLGFGLVADLLSSRPSNVVVSPVNVFSCLDVLRIGAGGRTREEIERVVGRPGTDEKIPSVLLGATRASAVFFDSDVRPKQEFVRESRERHDAEVLQVNFADRSGATAAINRWVAERTNGTIEEMLRGEVDESAKVIVVAALAFDGKWLVPFSPLVTEIGTFTTVAGTVLRVPIMSLEARLRVIRRNDYDAVALPYAVGNLVMYVVLPHKRGLQELRGVLHSFAPTDLKGFSRSGVRQTTFLRMPKFAMEGHFSLKESLLKQGMRTSFSPGLGNFSGFSEHGADGIFVSDILHSVRFEVNEHETMASAASAAIFTKSKYFQFTATRPFLFLIADGDGLLLFLGAVLAPE